MKWVFGFKNVINTFYANERINSYFNSHNTVKNAIWFQFPAVTDDVLYYVQKYTDLTTELANRYKKIVIFELKLQVLCCRLNDNEVFLKRAKFTGEKIYFE